MIVKKAVFGYHPPFLLVLALTDFIDSVLRGVSAMLFHHQLIFYTLSVPSVGLHGSSADAVELDAAAVLLY